MTKWTRRIRGAIGMGLTWAAGWALFGLLIGVTSLLLPGVFDPFFEVFDAPLPALAIPGFVGGALFSIVLGIAGRDRKFSELSVPGFAAWGALGGLLLTLFPFALVAMGLASMDGSVHSTGQLIAAVGGPFVLLSAVSAAGSLVLARRAKDRAVLDTISYAEREMPPLQGKSSELVGARVRSTHENLSARSRVGEDSQNLRR
jgi:hypothetical protein